LGSFQGLRILGFGEPPPDHRRVGGTGTQAVHADTARGGVDGDRTGHVDHAAFGGAVSDGVPSADESQVGGGEDQRPITRFHQGGKRASRHVELARQVDVDHSPPDLITRLRRGTSLLETRVRIRDVQAAEATDRTVYQTLHLPRIGHVGRDKVRIPQPLFSQGAEDIVGVSVVEGTDDHVGAFVAEERRSRAPYT